MSETWW